jgi:magnesium chelatase subunit D
VTPAAGHSTDRADAVTAAHAAALLSIDPDGLGGAVLVTTSAEHVRWFAEAVCELRGAAIPPRRLPVSITDDRLLGGLDIASSIARGRRIALRGVLAEADAGVVVVPLADRCRVQVAAALANVLDTGEVIVQRDGVSERHASRVVAVLHDEGAEGVWDVRVASALLDRIALVLAVPDGARLGDVPQVADVSAARDRLSGVACGDAARALVALATTLGIESMRAHLLALRVARANAAWRGATEIASDDLRVAVTLVLAPRATRQPDTEDPGPEAPDPPPTPEAAREESPADRSDIPQDILLAAVRAVLPPDLLSAGQRRARRSLQAGRRGLEQAGGDRGRHLRSVPGRPERGRRLDLVATLRAAAPWQRVRPRATGAPSVVVGREDLRVRRYKQIAGTTTILAVDASGSMALQRLAEAKGGVELLLARSYVRRDRVALIVFRGDRAVVLLPPTRALAHAKRALLSLPGGGGTPLASALDLVRSQIELANRDRQDAVAVILTDGKANVARDGRLGREVATQDALHVAGALRELDAGLVVVDTSPRGEERAVQLAAAMSARYVPLPHAAAHDLARVMSPSVGTSP